MQLRMYGPAIVIGVLAMSTSVAGAQTERKAGKPTNVAVTIYNQGFGLIKERRPMEIGAGRNRVIVEDVAAQIDPTSVSFKSITAPDAVTVREQNYLYDLISPTVMLNKSLGKRVTIRQFLGGGQTKDTAGTIVSPVTAVVANTGDDGGGSGTTYSGLIIRTDDGKLLINPPGQVILDEMPAGLIPRPQLVWLLDSDRAGAHDTEVSYMTQGITWKADYVATVSNDDKLVDITGWVTLDNKSGATFTDANLQLVAGDVRRVQPPTPRRRAGVEMMAMEAGKAAGGFQEESFFEYHLYTLEGTTSVRDNEQKQMTLMNAAKVPAVKKLIYDGRRGFWGIGNPGYQPGEGYDTSNYKKVNVVVEIKNAKPSMGIPLPKGRMRMYKADSRGALQFIGEDQIDHTPANETLKLYVGDSFDVVGEHKRTSFRRISDREVEEAFEVAVRNHRKEPANVSVVEHLWATWRIVEKSSEFVKKDASTVEFPVTVPPDGEVKVTYTVRTKW